MSNYDEHSERSHDSHRKKRRKIDDSTSTSANQHRTRSNNDRIRWKTSAEQQTYSTKLIDALRRVHLHHAPNTRAGGSTVRAAADKTLAMAARGRTRWSRAILSNRLKLCRKNHRKVKLRSRIPPPPPMTAEIAAEDTVVPPVEKRVKVLSRLVPGCRKLSFPNLLEETGDYIAALQMQVRAMTALAQLLAGSPPSAGLISVESSRSPNNVNDDSVH